MSDELERRVQNMLSGRAARVDPGESLDGAALRARAGEHQRTARRTVAQSLVAAAAVAVIAVATQLIPREPHHHAPPGEPAGVNNTAPATPGTVTPGPSTSAHRPSHPPTARPRISTPVRPSPATPSLDPARTRTGQPRVTDPTRSGTAVVRVPPASSSRPERPSAGGSTSPARSATAARVTSSSDR